jgi:hypothetical protein
MSNAERISEQAAVESIAGPGGRVQAARELLRLERRIARQEEALRVLRAHRDRLLTLISGA